MRKVQHGIRVTSKTCTWKDFKAIWKKWNMEIMQLEQSVTQKEFWLCYAGTALWFWVFFLFFIFSMCPLCHISYIFVCSRQRLSTDLLSECGDPCWHCFMKGCEVSGNWDNWFNVVTCYLSLYHRYCSPYFGMLFVILIFTLLWIFYLH